MTRNIFTIRKNTIRNTLLALAVTALLLTLIFLNSESTQVNINEETVRAADYSSHSAQNTPRDFELTISKERYEFIEGKKTTVFSYNQQIPGPLIKGAVGTTQNVIVHNNLDEPTTVHWHGLQLANVEDGVPEVTQEPILPGESFTYELELRNPGLYWYHSHVDAHKQVESGLQGVLLIEENTQIPPGNILVLDDALLGNDFEFRSFNLGVMHGRFGNILLVNGKEKPTIQLENNRLRIVNTANARSFNLQFGGEQFTVVGMDIGPSEHYMTNLLTISPGERYDILLPETTQESITLTHHTSRGSTQIATLITSDEKIDTNGLETFEQTLDMEPLLQKEPDYQADLIGVMAGHMNLRWTINNKAFPENPETFTIQEGKIVKFRIKNTQGQPHPMHLHGQKFIILSRNGIPEKARGWKDTVMINSREEVDIAFIAEDVGRWVFHCHILEHAEAGMLSIVEVVKRN